MFELAIICGGICEDTSLRAKVPEVKLSRRFPAWFTCVLIFSPTRNVNEARFQLKANSLK